VPPEPLLCKFADGGQKKRQSQGKYLQNGRPWTRDEESVSWFVSDGLLWKCCIMQHCLWSASSWHSQLSLFSREEWPWPMTPPQPYRMGQSYHQRECDHVVVSGLTACVSFCRFYSSPYSMGPNRMMGPTSLSPYMHSPMSTYQVVQSLKVKTLNCDGLESN